MAAPGRIQARENIFRAVIAALAGAADKGGEGASRALAQRWPEDLVSPLVLRAATGPATLTGSGWAVTLAQTAVADFIAGLGPASAASQLVKSSLQLEIIGGGVIVPGIVSAASATAFVADGAAIPVASLAIGGATLAPRKIAGIVTMTAETARSSAMEPIARQMLTESAALALDAAMFGSAAATDSAPAGLRNGAATVTATTGGGDTAMSADLALLADSVAPVAGSAITFVASPRQAARIALGGQRPFAFPVLAAAALADGVVMAIATNALVTAVDAVPEIRAGEDATLHMETAPLPLASGAQGSGVLATPSRSLWQTDTISLRLIMRASWALRAPAADTVAVVTSVTW